MVLKTGEILVLPSGTRVVKVENGQLRPFLSQSLLSLSPFLSLAQICSLLLTNFLFLSLSLSMYSVSITHTHTAYFLILAITSISNCHGKEGGQGRRQNYPILPFFDAAPYTLKGEMRDNVKVGKGKGKDMSHMSSFLKTVGHGIRMTKITGLGVEISIDR